MISPQYYNRNNTVNVYLGGKRPHFLQKERTVIAKSYEYRMMYGDNMYTLARKLFGDQNESFWIILGDMNELRDPLDWEEGEVIKLPELIVSETIETSFKIPVNVSVQPTKI